MNDMYRWHCRSAHTDTQPQCWRIKHWGIPFTPQLSCTEGFLWVCAVEKCQRNSFGFISVISPNGEASVPDFTKNAIRPIHFTGKYRRKIYIKISCGIFSCFFLCLMVLLLHENCLWSTVHVVECRCRIEKLRDGPDSECVSQFIPSIHRTNGWMTR